MSGIYSLQPGCRECGRRNRTVNVSGDCEQCRRAAIHKFDLVPDTDHCRECGHGRFARQHAGTGGTS